MDRILLGHGSGGRMMHDLIRDYFAPAFDMAALDDAAVINSWESGVGSEDSQHPPQSPLTKGGIKGGLTPNSKLCITTDSYVVDPIFFPGGDIGSLAVNGTVNDLCMVGAKPLFITVGLIIEEGLEIKDLKRILSSMKDAAKDASVKIIAGDTKVVNKGKADKIFINTSGIGILDGGINITGSGARSGDKIILSGSIGNHGIAVMAEREGLIFEPPVLSDTRSLNKLCSEMLSFTKEIHAMRDPTRGGLATTLKEIASASGVGILIHENFIPVEPGVKGACDILGFDPMYVANEGILVAFVKAGIAEPLLEVMRKNPFAKDAKIIGEVAETPKGTVLLQTAIGGKRIVDMLSGEQLPRIC